MIPFTASLLAAWLATYAFHATALLGGAWLLGCTPLFAAPAARDVLWKTALAATLATTTLHVAGLVPTLPAPAPAAGIVEAPVVVGSDALVATPATAPAAAPSVDPAAPAVPSGWAAWMVAAWLAVGLSLLAHRVRAYRRFLCALDRVPVDDAALLERLDTLERRAGLGMVRLTASPHLPAPIAVGRGEVCLPAWALEAAPEAQRAMLAHELAHLVRRDPLWLRAVDALAALLFFQPLLRVARNELQRAAEPLCDAWASDAVGGGRAVAGCLVDVARRWTQAAPSAPTLAAMASSPGALEQRVRLLLSGTPLPRLRPWQAAIPATLALAVLLAVPGFRPPPVPHAAAADTSAVRIVDPMVYRDGRLLFDGSGTNASCARADCFVTLRDAERSRVVFSTQRFEGAQRAALDRARIRFEWAGSDYEIRSSERIYAREAGVWVRFDQAGSFASESDYRVAVAPEAPPRDGDYDIPEPPRPAAPPVAGERPDARVAPPPPAPAAVPTPATAPARPAMPTLHLVSPVVYVDGREVRRVDGFLNGPGYVWLDVPEHGVFVIGRGDPTGFTRIGRAQGAEAVGRIDGRTIRILSERPFVTGRGATLDLYYAPSPGRTPARWGSGDAASIRAYLRGEKPRTGAKNRP